MFIIEILKCYKHFIILFHHYIISVYKLHFIIQYYWHIMKSYFTSHNTKKGFLKHYSGPSPHIKIVLVNNVKFYTAKFSVSSNLLSVLIFINIECAVFLHTMYCFVLGFLISSHEYRRIYTLKLITKHLGHPWFTI